jgi:hypothetical protein
MFPEESSARSTGRDAYAEHRIADTDRDRVVAVLRMHCTEGRITLDEFSDRVGDVYNARTQRELDAVVRDLPVPWSAEATREEPRRSARAAKPPRRPVQWLVAIFSNTSRRGRFRLDDESTAIAAFGDCTLDLSEALIDTPNPLITAVAAFGNVTIVVPDGIEVDLQGVPIFGSTRCDVGSSPAVPGSPVITVRAFAAFGDVRVRLPRDRGDRRFGRSRRP